MTTLRRFAPLSLALSLTLFATVGHASPGNDRATAIYDAGKAFAKPTTAPARGEGFLKRLGSAWKAGSSEYSLRKQAAGPGWLSRKATAISNFFKRDYAQTKADLAAAKTYMKADYAQTKADFASAKTFMKNDYAQTKADFASAKTFMKNDYAQTKADFQAAGAAIDRTVEKGVDKLAARHEANVAYKSGTADFNSWLKQTGDRDLATFNRGARKDSGVASAKFSRGMLVVGAVGNALGTAIAPNPFSAGAAVVGVVGSMQMKNDVRRSERAANTRTVEKALNSGVDIDSARLEGWVKAGIINDIK